MLTKEYIALENVYGANNYNPLPVVLGRGKGCKVWDVEGKEYLDFLAGYSALNFGHSHPRIVAAAHAQLDTLNVVSRAFRAVEWIKFAEKACKYFGAHKILPMNTGAEGVETAIKIVRKWGHTVKGVEDGKQEIIVFDGNFHGRTTTVISFSPNYQYYHGFGPLTPGFKMVKFGDTAAFRAAITPNTVATLAEFIQGEGGMRLPSYDAYWQEVKKECEKNNLIFIGDEVQTGMGRTGKLLAEEHFKMKADLTILGKSLGGGILPISAVLDRRGGIMDVLMPGDHGSTFGGNPLACAVASEAINTLEDEKLIHHSDILGTMMRNVLANRMLPHVVDIRGKGLTTGMELSIRARPICLKLLEKGIIAYYTKENILRLTPPLVITDEQLYQAIDAISAVLKE